MSTTIEPDDKWHLLWTKIAPADAAIVRSIPRSMSGLAVVELPQVKGWTWVSGAGARGVLTGEGLRAILTREGGEETELKDAVERAVEATLKIVRDTNRTQWGCFI